jgi:N-acetylated-alpha-linked acidic dipeptidase
MDDPGGGSDFAGFYNHLGIPHLDWGFGGPSGVYHSFYDSYHWMSTFGDTGFVYHATAGRIAAATALRLANAEVLPYDYAEFARTLRAQLPKLAPTLDGAGDASSLGAALDRMERAATALAAARDSALSSGRSSAATRDRANAALLRVERALTRPEGLHGRPWYRSLIFAADENNGYATVLFPSVTEAARRKDAALVTHELADLATRFDAASAALAEATAALRAAR